MVYLSLYQSCFAIDRGADLRHIQPVNRTLAVGSLWFEARPVHKLPGPFFIASGDLHGNNNLAVQMLTNPHRSFDCSGTAGRENATLSEFVCQSA
jgi:hypothetical protein